MSRKLVYIILTAALLLTLMIPAFAAEEESAEPVGFGTYSRYSVLEPEKLDELLEPFRKERELNENNFGVSLLYPATGETWSWNGDVWFVGRSLYKVPLNMILSNKIYKGELSWDEEIYTDAPAEIQEQSLVYSKNEVSERLMQYLGGMGVVRTEQKAWIGIADNDLPGNYLKENTYSPNAMVGIFKELYVNQEIYPNVIDQLKKANPGEYFKTNLEEEYTIAQKYGGGEGQLHCAGIIYMEQPVILCIMMQNAPHREEVIADLSEMIAAYMEDVNARLAEEIRADEEKAAEAKEQAEKAAEERAAARQASKEKAASEAKAAEERREAEVESNAKRMTTEVAVGVLAAGIVLVIVGLLRKRSERE